MTKEHETDATLLARIDERTARTENDVIEIKRSLSKDFVLQAEFKPVKLISFSFVGIICAAVIGALIKLVIS